MSQQESENWRAETDRVVPHNQNDQEDWKEPIMEAEPESKRISEISVTTPEDVGECDKAVQSTHLWQKKGKREISYKRNRN